MGTSTMMHTREVSPKRVRGTPNQPPAMPRHPAEKSRVTCAPDAEGATLDPTRNVYVVNPSVTELKHAVKRVTDRIHHNIEHGKENEMAELDTFMNVTFDAHDIKGRFIPVVRTDMFGSPAVFTNALGAMDTLKHGSDVTASSRLLAAQAIFDWIDNQTAPRWNRTYRWYGSDITGSDITGSDDEDEGAVARPAKKSK